MHPVIDELSPAVLAVQSAPTPIDLARTFVKAAVQIPALESTLGEKFKRKIEHSDFWLDKFSRVGDLFVYLQRFDASDNDPMYQEMKRNGLLTFEDIVGRFREKFALWVNDCSRITDFIVGREYSVYDILILAKNYDTRAGGMFVLDSNDTPTAVVIKATLSNGRYPNVWLEEGEVLKYYLKSISGTFGEHFKPNQAILNNPSIPIVTFTRDSDKTPFIFRGLFRYQDIVYEKDGGKAFILKRDNQGNVQVTTDAAYDQATLENRVGRSSAGGRSERLKRLAKAKKRPAAYSLTTTAYSRNADVIAEVLFQAKGACQGCGNPAPFRRKSDNAPYLEVHHKVPLSMNGEDTVENAIALCPNCHRERHFGTTFGSAYSVPADSTVEGAEAALQDAIAEKI